MMSRPVFHVAQQAATSNTPVIGQRDEKPALSENRSRRIKTSKTAVPDDRTMKRLIRNGLYKFASALPIKRHLILQSYNIRVSRLVDIMNVCSRPLAARVIRLFYIRRRVTSITACTALALLAVGCGSRTSDSAATITPTAPTTGTSADWTITSDKSSSHVAQFRAANGTVFDFWRGEIGAGRISDIRSRRPDGSVIYIQIDSNGRLVYLEDPVGTSIRINRYVSSTSLDVTVRNKSGVSWQGLLEVPTALIGRLNALQMSFRHGVSSPLALTGLTDAEELSLIGDLVCTAGALKLLDYLDVALCAIDVVAGTVVPLAGIPLAILSCAGQTAVEQLLEDLVCTWLLSGSKTVLDPQHVTTAVLTEPNSPIQTPTPTPTPAPIARDDSYSMSRGGVLTKPAPGVLANDTIPAGSSGIYVDFGIASGTYPPPPGDFTNLSNSGSPGGFILDMRSNSTYTGSIVLHYYVGTANMGKSNVATVTIGIQ